MLLVFVYRFSHSPHFSFKLLLERSRIGFRDRHRHPHSVSTQVFLDFDEMLEPLQIGGSLEFNNYQHVLLLDSKLQWLIVILKVYRHFLSRGLNMLNLILGECVA